MAVCGAAQKSAAEKCQQAYAQQILRDADYLCRKAYNEANFICAAFQEEVAIATVRLMECLQKGCKDPDSCIPCETNFFTGETHCKAPERE